MYECNMKAPTTLVDREGKKWTVGNFRMWRFTFEDESAVEFWMKRYPVREQDTELVGRDRVKTENVDIYERLRERLQSETQGSMVVKIRID